MPFPVIDILHLDTKKAGSILTNEDFSGVIRRTF